MRLCKTDTLVLLSWHGGQSSACYAAGSNSLTGRPVAAETLRAARVELARCQAWVNAMHEEDPQLDRLLRRLSRV